MLNSICNQKYKERYLGKCILNLLDSVLLRQQVMCWRNPHVVQNLSSYISVKTCQQQGLQFVPPISILSSFFFFLTCNYGETRKVNLFVFSAKQLILPYSTAKNLKMSEQRRDCNMLGTSEMCHFVIWICNLCNLTWRMNIFCSLYRPARHLLQKKCQCRRYNVCIG